MASAEPESARAQRTARLPPVLGLIGTFLLCAAALMAHLSPGQLKPVAIVLWVLGLAIQILAFGKACAKHSNEDR